MRNEAADIVQDHPEEAPEWKAKARVAGNAAWDATKAAYHELHDRTAACTRATDQAIRGNPYTALAVAFGVGMLAGVLMTRNGRSEKGED